MKKTPVHPATHTALPWAALVLLWMLAFVPHLLHTGFISDDWSVVRSGVAFADFSALYRSWFPLFSNRPAAPLVLSLVSRLCGAQPLGYSAANLTMWLASLVMIAMVLRRFFSARFPFVFLAVASFPSLASTVLFSVAMQLVAVASLLCWALSFYLLDRYLQKRRLLALVLSNGLVLVSLLIYEITLPLLVINVLYPCLFHDWRRQGAFKRYLPGFVLPPFGLLCGIFLLQKVVMPLFMPVYSRLSPGSLGTCLGTAVSWTWSVLVDFPLLLIDALQRVFVSNPNEVNLALPAVLAAATVGFLLFRLKDAPSAGGEGESRKRGALLVIALLALVSASSLYILSGCAVQVGGYGNRGLTSTWILLALVVACASELYRGALPRLMLFCVIVLNLASFMLQRDNYALSWSLQKEIARSLATQFRKENPAQRSGKVLAHVPPHVPFSYNQEEIFQNSWDLRGAVWWADHALDLDAMPVNPANVKALRVNGEGLRLNYWDADLAGLWYYEYDARLGRARLSRVPGPAEARALPKKIAASDCNMWPASLPLRTREAFNGSMPFALLAVMVAYGGIFRLLRRRRADGELYATAGEPCRVCGGVLFRTVKEGDVDPGSVSAEDLKITDSSYGATYAIARCAGCGFLQSDSHDALSRYQLMEDPEYEAGRSARAMQFQAILQELSRWTSGSRLLDVGAGSGILVEEAMSRGYRAQGIEPSAWMAGQAAQRGLPVVAGVLPDRRVAGPFEAVTLLDVIEHVCDPASLLAEIRHLLTDGGYLVLTTPDVSSVAARIMGRRWWHYRVAHISYFDAHTVELLLQRAGFEVVRLQRMGWYFELSYLAERLIKLVPGMPAFSLPAALSRIIVPLNLFDSMLLVCRKKP